MSMVKEIPPFDGPGDVRTQLIKASSTWGLRGSDLTNFVKRAGHPLADWVRRHPPEPGEALVHLIALGSTEKYSCNRNADGYPDDMLRGRHWTFEKFARFYRNHANKNPEISYGVVRKSYHNPEMERVELICALNETKEAANRNRGLVADRECQLLSSGRDIDVSQSVKIDFDVCVACHNQAKNRSEYCGPEKCAKYGGCRHNLGRVFNDGFHLFVNNPNGTFFDISNVSDTRGADRTAFITGKVAAADRVVGGAEAAELLGITIPDYVLGPATVAAGRVLVKLASAQVGFDPGCRDWSLVLKSRGKELPRLPSKSAAMADRHRWVSDAAYAGLVLPPAWWLAAYSGAAVEKVAAFFGDSRESPRALADHPDRVDLLAGYAMAEPSRVNSFDGYAPSSESEEKLAWLVAGGLEVKTASGSTGSPSAVHETLLRYTAYQANVLAIHENSMKFPLLLAESLRHNRNLPW